MRHIRWPTSTLEPGWAGQRGPGTFVNTGGYPSVILAGLNNLKMYV